jgi:ornithine cyclodeaminase/alanine dehydrogenase-like protein (mu-crystallin family)
LNLICDKNISKLGIIGLGVQGYWQAIFAANTRNIVEIHCHSRNKIKFEAFREKVLAKFPQVSIHWSSTSEAVVEASEAIISCTPSKRPVFEAKGMNISEKRFISIGSFTKDMQELPNEVYIQADAMILDTKAAESEVGDVINTLNNNWIPRENIYTLADILSGKRSVDKHSNVVFKSVGMAAFDLALAIAIYEQNRQK